MSLILKGIDIPKDAEYFSVTFYKKGTYRKEKIMDIDQAIQIPKDHGRLIDESDIDIPRWDIDRDVVENISNAPTILEAEE